MALWPIIYQINKMKKNIATIFLAAVLICFATSALAQVTIPNPLGTTNDFGTLLTNGAKKIAEFVGALSVIMIIWAGILFLTSAGRPEAINKAKSALTYAIIGIVVAILASGIIELIQSIIGKT